MWLWRWWQWWIGEVTFSAEGGLCEDFLNLLTEQEGVSLWDVHKEEDRLTACCRASSYRAVRRPARRTGTRVRATAKRGCCFRFRRVSKRVGLLIGAAIAMAIYMILASFIWVIDVQVEDPLLAARVEEALGKSGLAVGTPSGAVDLGFVRMHAITELSELHHVAVYLDGCTARVEVRLQEPSAPLPDKSPSNVVAAFDGRIVEMQVASGQAMVKTGDAVVQGDLLVCGAIETQNGVLLKHASAVINAETSHTFCVEVPLCETRPVREKRIVQTRWRCLWWELPLFSSVPIGEDYTVTERYTPLRFLGTDLPVGVHETVYSAPCDATLRYTAEQAECIAKRRLQAHAAATLEDAVIRRVTYEGVWEDEVYRLRGVYDCTEDIALQAPLLSDFA